MMRDMGCEFRNSGIPNSLIPKFLHYSHIPNTKEQKHIYTLFAGHIGDTTHSHNDPNTLIFNDIF